MMPISFSLPGNYFIKTSFNIISYVISEANPIDPICIISRKSLCLSKRLMQFQNFDSSCRLLAPLRLEIITSVVSMVGSSLLISFSRISASSCFSHFFDLISPLRPEKEVSSAYFA